MSHTVIRYFDARNLEAARLARAAFRMFDAMGAPPTAIFASVKQASSHSPVLFTPGSLPTESEVRPGFELQFHTRVAPLATFRLTVDDRHAQASLSGDVHERVRELLDGFADEAGLVDSQCLALALSGGGFRATLFHLGVLRYLNEIGKLKDVVHICSVSGGSILAAHLVRNWSRYQENFDEAAREILDCVESDMRNRLFRKWIAGLISVRFLPRIGKRWQRIALLQQEYDTHLFHGDLLKSLARQNSSHALPELHILATAMRSGRVCSFSGDGLHVSMGNGDHPSSECDYCEQVVGGSLLRISFAVAASSAFPPVFAPVRVDHRLLRVDISQFQQETEYLSDGGVYDNLGICRLQHLRRDTHLGLAALLISDAEAPFEWTVGADYGAFWERALRASNILMKRVADLEYLAALSPAVETSPPVLACRLSTKGIESPYALPDELVDAVSRIRTDLDRFSPLEVRCLVQQGFLVAQKTIRDSGIFATKDPRVYRPPWDPTGVAASASRSGSPDDRKILKDIQELESTQNGVHRWLPAVFSFRDKWSLATAGLLFLYLTVLVGIALIPTWLKDRELATAQQELTTKEQELTTKDQELTTNQQELTKTSAKLEQELAVWATTREFFSKDWTFQISYRSENEIRDRVSDLPPEDNEKQADLKRLLALAGQKSEIVEANVMQRKIKWDDDKMELWKGKIPNFRFPGSKNDLLLEFMGRAPAGAREITLEFQQSELSKDTPEPVVVVFVSEFQFQEDGQVVGAMRHPVLLDRDGDKLEIADIYLVPKS